MPAIILTALLAAQSLTAAAPCTTARVAGKVVTVTGPAKEGAEEWSVFLKGNRLYDVREGDRLRVRGVLHVIRHPTAFVNGQFVPAWAEVRLTEG
jgi:hypothetical protein